VRDVAGSARDHRGEVFGAATLVSGAMITGVIDFTADRSRQIAKLGEVLYAFGDIDEVATPERLTGFEEPSESGVVGGPSAHQGYLQ
jgi:hypothetical protein